MRATPLDTHRGRHDRTAARSTVSIAGTAVTAACGAFGSGDATVPRLPDVLDRLVGCTTPEPCTVGDPQTTDGGRHPAGHTGLGASLPPVGECEKGCPAGAAARPDAGD